MSDQNTQAVTFSGGQATPVPASQGAPNADEPQFLTRKEADALVQKAVDEAVKRAQSLTDKAESRIKKEFQQRKANLDSTLKQLKEAGVEITPEVRQRAEAMLLQDTLAQPEPAPEPLPQRQPSKVAEPELDPVSAQAMRMMQRAGVIIEDNDPEAGEIDQTDPDAFLLSVAKAIVKKQQRTASQPPETPKAPTSAGGMGGVTAQATPEDYIKEMMAARGQGRDKINAIREAYRKKGVDVDRVALRP